MLRVLYISIRSSIAWSFRSFFTSERGICLDVVSAPLFAYWFQVGIFSVRHRKTQSAGKGIFLCFLDALDLFPPFSGRLCSRIFDISIFLVTLGIPVEVTPFCPSTNGSHQRMAQVVFTTRRVLNIGPFEIGTTAARAFFPDCSQEIHVEKGASTNASTVASGTTADPTSGCRCLRHYSCASGTM